MAKGQLTSKDEARACRHHCKRKKPAEGELTSSEMDANSRLKARRLKY